MRGKPIVIVVAVLLSGPTGSVMAQDATKTLLERAIKAHGGEEQLGKLRSGHSHTQGTLHLHGGITFSQDSYFHLPGRIKEVLQTESNGKKSMIVTVFNQGKGAIEVESRYQDVDARILTELAESAHLADVTRLVVLKDKNYELSPVEEIKVEERPAVGFKVSRKGFRDVTLYFDKESSLLVKTHRQTLDTLVNRQVSEDKYYGGYKEVGGLKTPRKIVVLRDGKKFMEAEATEVKFVEKMDESIFALPEKTRR